MAVGTSPALNPAPHPAVCLRLLGPLAVSRGGEPLVLPPSRKVRALLAYLALAGHACSRSHLCELLWDLPGDPRGELRWCLSRLRGLLDEPGQTRVIAQDDAVALDLAGVEVDARVVGDALRRGIAGLPAAALEALAARLAEGEFLEGLDLPRAPVFNGWLVAERRRFRAAQVAVLEHWVHRLPTGSDAALRALERWIALAPFDRRAHEHLLDALAATGRLREGDEHLAQTARRYDGEGQDWAPIGHAWRAARLRHARPPAAADTPAPAEAPMPAHGLQVLPPPPALPEPTTRRASLLVMPFADHTRGGGPQGPMRGGLGDGMAHDLITRLAKLRSLFVIATGTAFVLDERKMGAEDAGRRLDVDYVASGSLQRQGDARLSVTVQLAETRSARVIWADTFAGRLDDTLAVLGEIGDRIVTAVAQQVEVAERNRAVLKSPHSLDAWEAHHRGLWHMMRFNREDNEQARHFFLTAVRLDPTFARPYAGLSFTHFQDAFLGWMPREAAVERAYRIAAQGLMADERDPATHWALGRALWLQGRQDEGLGALETSVELSPSFALGHYTLAFVHAQSGDPQLAIAGADQSRALSPFDPLLFGFLGTRAMALMRLGRHDEAADWALKAAGRPNAHVHILAIAAHCLVLAGRAGEAARMATEIRRRQPAYGVDDFLAAFRLEPGAEALVRRAALQWSQGPSTPGPTPYFQGG